MSPPPLAAVRHVRRHVLHVHLQEYPGLAALEEEHGRLARQRPELRGALVHLALGEYSLLATRAPIFQQLPPRRRR